MSKSRWAIALLMALLLQSTAASAETFSISSPPHRTALLELYTSQGCSSCPPTENWLAQLRGPEFGASRVVPIALHVDYWDYIGWEDQFAHAAHTLRQRHHVKRNRLATAYTPQLILNGRDLRPRHRLRQQLQGITSQPAPADINLRAVVTNNQTLDITCTVSLKNDTGKNARLYLAIAENNLTTAIKAGENQGHKLRHEHVVRLMLDPIPVTWNTWQGTLSLNPNWQSESLELVAFIESSEGAILQAVALPLKAHKSR